MTPTSIFRLHGPADNENMPIENLFMDDLPAATPADLEKAIVQLAKSGVEEKFRLDFKELWQPDKQCPDIVALANSYGGLLIVGVSDDRQRLPGTPPPTNSDLKTQISSTIASRISPVPLFEVHTCPASQNPPNVLVVIRVAPQPRVYMYLKGDKPVYVRQEDGTVPARAAQLQALLDRVRLAEGHGVTEPSRILPTSNDFLITKALNREDPFAKRQAQGNRHRSDTTLMITAVPERRLAVEIDTTLEQQFKRLIDAIYPSIEARRKVDSGTFIMEREDRRSSWFQYLHQDLDRDHEIAWAFDHRANVQCLFEVAGRTGDGADELWSLPDLFVSINGSLMLAHELWTKFGFYGNTAITAKLEIPKLVPILAQGHYQSLFYDDAFMISESAVRQVYASYPISAAAAADFLTYDQRTRGRQDKSDRARQPCCCGIFASRLIRVRCGQH